MRTALDLIQMQSKLIWIGTFGSANVLGAYGAYGASYDFFAAAI